MNRATGLRAWWVAAAAVCANLWAPNTALAAENWITGTIIDVTTTTEGLMIRLDNGIPTDCTGTPLGWMLIREANKTMVATTLMLWQSGNRQVTVYIGGFQGNFCYVNQVDPV